MLEKPEIHYNYNKESEAQIHPTVERVMQFLIITIANYFFASQASHHFIAIMILVKISNNFVNAGSKMYFI